jgi:hypothetical protein
MGYYYNPDCQMQNCTELCCNSYGNCPVLNSTNSRYRDCWGYYNYIESGTGTCTTNACTTTDNTSSSSNSGLIGGAAGGGTGLLIFLICIYCYCRK